jgi:hypothetical protein
MAKRAGIFPTFFLSGFECSTFVWKDQGRRNLIAETQHDTQVHEDYQLLRRLGLPWPVKASRGRWSIRMGTMTFRVLIP